MAMPRTVPSSYGQTVGGSSSSRRHDFNGSAAAAVGKPRTRGRGPLTGGKNVPQSMFQKLQQRSPIHALLCARDIEPAPSPRSV